MSQSPKMSLSTLIDLIQGKDADRVRLFMRELPPGHDARLATRLTQEDQRQLFQLLPPEDGARVLKELSVSQAAAVLEELSPQQAAALLEPLPSNEQTDLLAELADNAEAVLGALSPIVAQRVRELRNFGPDTAGGLMIAEFLAYPEEARVRDVIEDLRFHAPEYSRFQAQYAYITDASRQLVGVLRLRDLLLMDHDAPIDPATTRDPLRVSADMPIEELMHLFDRHPYFGLPVIDSANRLIGVVLQADVEEALSERADRRLLLISGVLGGEEYRSFHWTNRVVRRIPWLAVSLVLSLFAASVIGWYQETLASAIALTVFLPVISGMGGNSGNQALAVSIRELSLGQLNADEFLRVILKEASVGLANGLTLAAVVASIAWIWQRNLQLSVVVGVAIGLNILVSACLGGIVPLLLKRVKLDPALASGPILAAVNDMCGFLLALVLADAFLLPAKS